MASAQDNAIDAAAADWAARIDREPLSAQDSEALEAWLAADSRNRGAFMRMRAIALHTERAKALGAGFDPDAFLERTAAPRHAQIAKPSTSGRSIARRGVLWAGGAAVAATAVGGVGVFLLGRGVLYQSQLGQVRVVTLEDGSVITLNTASKVEVSFDTRRRSLRMIEGEALFDVAKDAARPFVIDAGDGDVRAVGTSFTVRVLPGEPVVVLVREGIVEVRPTAAAPASAPVRLTANMQAEMAIGAASPKVFAVTLADVDRELAWREGRIAFEGATLDAAAAAFARYSDTRIVFADPSIGREEITGLFDADDPVSFAKAAALSLGLHSDVEAGQVRLRR